MSSCLNSCGLCGNAYQDPGASRAGTMKSRAPSGVERVIVGVSISTKSWASRTARAAALTLLRKPDRRARCRAAQVEVPVLEARLLPHVDAFVDLERQRRAGVEDVDRRRDDLDLPGRQVGVLVALGAPTHLAGHLDAVLVADVVGAALGEHLVAGDHLHHARRVAQVEEGHTAVVAPPGHPSRERDGLAGLVGSQRAGLVGAEHGGVLRMEGGEQPGHPMDANGWLTNRWRPGRPTDPRRRLTR